MYDCLLQAVRAVTGTHYIWQCRLTDKLHPPDTIFRRVRKIAQSYY